MCFAANVESGRFALSAVVFNYIVGKGVSVPAVLLVLVAEKHSVVGVFIDTVVFENIVGILVAY